MSAGPALGEVIEVRGLVKHFGNVEAVRGVDFTVVPGRITGFLGPNGAGKTTTLRMLLDLVHPTAGTATIGGLRYHELDEPIRHVGAVLEATSFHPARRARAHLRMLATAGGIDRERVDAVLGLVGLSADAQRRVGGFSLGMRQRLELAGALLGDPGVLILDEPANGLDPQGIAWLRDFLRFLASQGKTVLVSSHVLTEMALIVDDVVIVSLGEVRAAGPLASLLASVRPSVVVKSPETDRLAAVLASERLAHRRPAADTVIVDAAVQQVGPILARHQVVVYEMYPEQNSLETVFFGLTQSLGFAQPPPVGAPGAPAQGWSPPPAPGAPAAPGWPPAPPGPQQPPGTPQ